ncbi:Inosose dehydratase [compost metagenome]
MKNKLAVQLYTLRDACKEDFPGVLRALSVMGWAGVQFAGFHDYDLDELKAVMQETGLKAAGMHVGMDDLFNHTEKVCSHARLFETVDIILPSIPQQLQNEDGYIKIKQQLNQLAAQLKDEGFRISYHNHAFEFNTQINGQSALAYLLNPAQDNDILAEIDVYWVKKGGYDPLTFIQTYAGRMPIIHLKDMTNDDKQSYAEIGTGSIDFVPILQWGEASGVEWYVVEQDTCPTDPMTCIQTSFNNLTKMIEQ